MVEIFFAMLLGSLITSVVTINFFMFKYYRNMKKFKAEIRSDLEYARSFLNELDERISKIEKLRSPF